VKERERSIADVVKSIIITIASDGVTHAFFYTEVEKESKKTREKDSEMK